MKASEQFDWSTKDAQNEISAFLPLLSGLGISREDVIKGTPRSWKDREKAKGFARSLANNSEIAASIRVNRNPPPQQLLEQLGLDPGFFQRFPVYITALVLIMSQFPILTTMVTPWPGGEI